MQIYERRAKFGSLSKDVSFAERVVKVQDMFEPYELSLELAAGEVIFETEDGILKKVVLWRLNLPKKSMK